MRGDVLWSGVRVGLGVDVAGAASAGVGAGDGRWWICRRASRLGAVPGSPQRVNSEPMSMAVSPDGRYVVTVNAGYGTFESKYEQSLAVMDTQTGRVADFPDERTATTGKQTLYSGLAFSADGKHLYASMASLTRSDGECEGRCGEWDCGVWVRCGEDYAGEIDPDCRCRSWRGGGGRS